MSPVPNDLQRVVSQIDGWLELICPDRALELLPPLFERPEARPTALWLRIRAYVTLKRHREAMQDLAELREVAVGDHGVDLRPDRIDIADWIDLTEAWCRKRLQDLQGAIHCVEHLLERNPQSAHGHFNLGCYLALAGDRERALDEVTLACGLDGDLRGKLDDEPDLDCLRKDERFQQLRRRSDDTPAGDADNDAVDDFEDFEDESNDDAADDDDLDDDFDADDDDDAGDDEGGDDATRRT